MKEIFWEVTIWLYIWGILGSPVGLGICCVGERLMRSAGKRISDRQYFIILAVSGPVMWAVFYGPPFWFAVQGALKSREELKAAGTVGDGDSKCSPANNRK